MNYQDTNSHFQIQTDFKVKQEYWNASKEIRAQKDEVETQRDEIAAQRNLVTVQTDKIQQQNEAITDSIDQAATFPPGEVLRYL